MTIMDIVGEPIENLAYFTFSNCSTYYRIDLFGQIAYRAESGIFLPVPATCSWLRRTDFYWCDQYGTRLMRTAKKNQRQRRTRNDH